MHLGIDDLADSVASAAASWLVYISYADPEAQCAFKETAEGFNG